MYQIPELLKYPKLFHAFSEKEDGNLSFEFSGIDMDGVEVLGNRKRFLKKVGVDIGDVVGLWVQHKNDIFVAKRKNAGVSMMNKNDAIKVDGAMTNERGLYLNLLIADCLPVILYDPVKLVITLVHIGWRNADNNTIGIAIDKMKSVYGVKADDLAVGLGPAALKDSFIKKNPLQVNDPKWKDFVENIGEDDYKVDFVGLCKKQILDKGVKKENIFECGIDTVKDERFYSHLRDHDKDVEEQGRFTCIVGLK